jgi:hypothetical protein
LAYRGGDIDTIELVSGDEGATGRALKSYNYRVVMRKGDIPLDMRVSKAPICEFTFVLRDDALLVRESWQVS